LNETLSRGVAVDPRAQPHGAFGDEVTLGRRVELAADPAPAPLGMDTDPETPLVARRHRPLGLGTANDLTVDLRDPVAPSLPLVLTGGEVPDRPRRHDLVRVDGDLQPRDRRRVCLPELPDHGRVNRHAN